MTKTHKKIIRSLTKIKNYFLISLTCLKLVFLLAIKAFQQENNNNTMHIAIKKIGNIKHIGTLASPLK